MDFLIEQIALCPPNPEKAIELLRAMGMNDWVHDIVVARGAVRPDPNSTAAAKTDNVAQLAFSYESLSAAKELEVLHYTAGKNWMEGIEPSVSHLGMHCSMSALNEWKAFFRRHRIGIAQEVDTLSHNNPAIAGKRWYHYCIFDTRAILGVDIKFIVRKDTP